MVDGSLPLSAVRVALCVPRSCGPDALQTALRASVGRPHVDVHVRPEHCRQPDDEAEASDTGTTVFWALLAALTLAAILGPSLGWSSWDWRRHSRSLGLPDPNVSGLDLSALSGIRTLNSMYLVMLHRGIHTARCAISNKDFITSQARSRKSLTLLYRGALGVDTFFFLAGLLLALPARRQPFAKSLANRVVRVLPVYALVLLFHCTALPSLGAGPLWAEVAEPMARACRRWGWTNLLFVNNYVHGGTAEHMCMEHSWSLAVDMHMFLLSSMLLVRLPSGLARLASLAGLALLAAVPLFLGTLLGGWPATVTWTLRTMQGMWAEQHVHSAYTPTHMRAAPYLLGLLAGTALPMLQARGFRPGRLASLGLTALGLAVMAGVMCGSAPFNDASTPYAPLSAALYAGLAPVTWAVGLALVVVANVLGERTVVRALLSWQPLVTLSRLTFGVYLVSYPLQALITASKRDAVRITPLTLVGDSLSDVVLTFLVSYWLFVVLEAPLRTMAKKALATKSRSAEPSAQAAPTTKAGAEKTD